MKVYDFMYFVEEMKKWVDGMSVRGGGDGFELVVCVLDVVFKFNYRKDVIKICVFIGKLKFYEQCGQVRIGKVNIM